MVNEKQHLEEAIDKTVKETQEVINSGEYCITTLLDMEEHRRNLQFKLDNYDLYHPEFLKSILVSVVSPFSIALAPLFLVGGLVYLGVCYLKETLYES